MRRILAALLLTGGAAACSDRATAPLAPSVTANRADADDPGFRDEKRGRHERYLYVATIAKSAADPDFITVVGADPRHKDFGQVVTRVDMPNVGDELHHFGYSSDQKRLIVPGLFSNRIHVFTIGNDR